MLVQEARLAGQGILLPDSLKLQDWSPPFIHEQNEWNYILYLRMSYFLMDEDMASSEVFATSSSCSTISSGSRTVTGLLGFFSSFLASSVLLLDFSSYNKQVYGVLVENGGEVSIK